MRGDGHEIWFYNLFIAEEAIGNTTYDAGERDKTQFVSKDSLNMDLVLRKFVQHFEESFGNSTDSFIEENGRKLFLLYIRPLINGTGNYYIESRTRSMGRTDLIIDYRGVQYVIEMKIWHGNEYNTRGEQQLIGYLKDYGLKKVIWSVSILIRPKPRAYRNCTLKNIPLLRLLYDDFWEKYHSTHLTLLGKDRKEKE